MLFLVFVYLNAPHWQFAGEKNSTKLLWVSTLLSDLKVLSAHSGGKLDELACISDFMLGLHSGASWALATLGEAAPDHDTALEWRRA